MEKSKFEYKNINFKVRPHRIATLVKIDDKYWKHSILELISWYSKVWGGGFGLIIPTDGKTILPIFWDILEKYSPDCIAQYNYPFAELEKANPRAYRKALENQRLRLTQLNGLSIDQIEDELQRSVDNSRRINWSISTELLSELSQRLVPFSTREDRTVREHVNGGDGYVGFPFTDMTDICGNTLMESVCTFDADQWTGNIDFKLFLYATTGCFTSKTEEKLRNCSPISFEKVSGRYEFGDLVNDVVKGSVDRVARNLSLALGGDGRAWSPRENLYDLTPFSFSLFGTSKYFPVGGPYIEDNDAVCVIGDDIRDFCLYYSLSRMRPKVYWISAELFERFGKALRIKRRTGKKLTNLESLGMKIAQAIVSEIGFGINGEKIRLITQSLSMTKMKALQRLCIRSTICNQPDVFIIDDGTYQLLQKTWELIETNNYSKQETLAIEDNVSTGFIDTPKPKNFKEINPAKHRWVTELHVNNYDYPALDSLCDNILSIGRVHDVRITNHNVAYLCPSIGYFGGDIDVVLTRPKLKFMETEDIFKAYYAEAGFPRAEISDKGRLLRAAIGRFDSLSELSKFLCTPQVVALFEDYLANDSFYDQSLHSERNKLQGRMYLNFKRIEQLIGSTEDTEIIIDGLVSKHILMRGYTLKCNSCLSADWYSLDELKQTFICHRCDTEQIITKRHWMLPSEPSIFYKLNEIFRSGYVQNMRVPALTNEYFRRASKTSFFLCHEMALWRGDNIDQNHPDSEIDVNCISDGKIILGECKRSTITKGEIMKYGELVKSLPRKPDVVVFSTLEQDFSDEIHREIQKVPNSLILTARELVFQSEVHELAIG